MSDRGLLASAPAAATTRSVELSLPGRRPAPGPSSLRRELRGPVLLGVAILVAFFLLGGGWAATAPIAGAAVASGVVSPQGSRQRVQHRYRRHALSIQAMRIRGGQCSQRNYLN